MVTDLVAVTGMWLVVCQIKHSHQEQSAQRSQDCQHHVEREEKPCVLRVCVQSEEFNMYVKKLEEL